MICCKLDLTVTPCRPAHGPCSTWHRNGNCNKTSSAYTFSRRLRMNAENHPGDAMSGSGCPVSCLDACRSPGRAGNLLIGCDHSHAERFPLLLSVDRSVSQDEPGGNLVQSQDFIVSFRHFLAFPFTFLLEKKSIAFMRNARIIKTS